MTVTRLRATAGSALAALLLTTALTGTAAPSAHAATACANTTMAPTASNVAVVRASVLCLVNNERTARGLGALADNAQLNKAAQGHSQDMVARRYFSHTTPEGTTFSSRIFASGYATSRTYRALAENIAWGSGSLGTPAQIVKSWMGSSGHRANILNGNLRDSGIGIAAGTPTGARTGGTYTQDFGTR
jgi:uncharacterized protein YkwD